MVSRGEILVLSSIISSIKDVLVWLPAIIIALTFHEYAHGRVAYWLGDKTAYYAGRLTLNPLPHIDWIGFLMLVFLRFGWAKPVPVNPVNLRKTSMKTGMLLVSVAGPLMNMLLALSGMIMLRLALNYLTGETAYLLVQLLVPFIYINLVLAIFNLVPVPPLDGSKILAGILPDSWGTLVYRYGNYGYALLLLLVFTGLIGKVLGPLIQSAYQLLYALVF